MKTTILGFIFTPFLSLLLLPYFVVINYSPSLPLGIYIRSFAPIKRGSIVVFNKEGVLKYVAALEGDRVRIGVDGYYINENHIGSVINTQHYFSIQEIVRAGVAYLYSPHPRSYDSRYFGPVPIHMLRNFSPLCMIYL